MESKKLISKDLEWIEDTPLIRSYHNKRIKIKAGEESEICLMIVSEAGPNGERKDGHVLVTVSPIIEDHYSEARFDRLKDKMIQSTENQ